MSTWTVTNRMTGEVAYAYVADAPDHLALYPFDTYNHTAVGGSGPSAESIAAAVDAALAARFASIPAAVWSKELE